jgi:CHAT domain-containing protein
MKLYVALLLSVLCLAFPAYAPEAQDKAGESQDAIENLTTVAARQEALAARMKSAREFQQANDPVKAAQLLNEAGRLQLKLNLPKEALATFQESLTLTNQVHNPVAEVDALNGAGAACLHSARPQDALPYIQKAIATSEQNNYVFGRAEALLLLSDCENRTTKHSQALKTAHEALTLWQAIGNPRGIIRAQLKVATYQFALNSLEEATRSNETAHSLANKGGFKDLEAESLINLGFIEYRKGAWSGVTKFLWDARKLVDADSDPLMMTRITGTIAEAYLESGQLEIALQKYEEALEYIRKASQPRGVTIVKWSIGRILFFAGKYPEARDKFQESVREAELLNEPAVLAMCLEFLGRTHDALGDPASALQSLETALNLYSDADNPMEVARTRALIGQVHENGERFEQARNFYQQALQTFDKHSDRVNQSATLFALGRLEMKSGNYDRAETYLKQSIEVTENMRRKSTSRDLTAAFSATVHDRYEQYIQCLMRNHRDPASLSRVIRAFETSESARARSLAELLSITDTNLLSNLDPELSQQERSLRQLLRVKEDARVALLRGKHEKSQLEKADAELEQLNTDYKNVVATINKRYPAFGQLTQPQSWNLRRIQEEVIGDDDTVLLEYILGRKKSYIWAATRNGITSHDLPPQDEITEAVKKVYELASERPTPATQNNLDQATNELARMILSPVADQLQKKRILVAADGVLNYIPFQILPVTQNEEPLVAQHEVINVPSASILGELREEAERRGVRDKVLAAFGNPVFADKQQNDQTAVTRGIEIKDDPTDPTSFGRLFYSAREIENLREVASAEQTYTATESDATRDQLLNMDFSQFAILHFATHGSLLPSSPENSGLWLSTINREGQKVDGFVGLQDIYSLRAPVDLVVLSACQTALGKDIRGEGLIGLTRGFMYAGATSVVASVWKVEDEVTAELMKRFYTEMLRNGKTPAEALRLAQNSIRQEPQWSAPHYWAGFTLQGEYRYVVNSARGRQTYQIVLLSVAALLLVCASGVFLWRKVIRR